MLYKYEHLSILLIIFHLFCNNIYNKWFKLRTKHLILLKIKRSHVKLVFV